MKLKFGTYEWPVNGVKVSSTRVVERDRAGVPVTFTDTIDADGYLEAEGQAALTVAQNEMMRELLRPYRDLVFLCDDDSESATVLRNSSSLTGVVVTDGPHFRDVMGPEYVSVRHFQFRAEASYLYPNRAGRDVLEWRETVAMAGGGPLYVVKPALEGPPQRQLVCEQMPWTATQTGYAVGFTDYPDPAPAIWPFALKERPQVRRVDPDKQGPRGAARYTKFRLEWTYTYEWTSPLEGFPNRWL